MKKMNTDRFEFKDEVCEDCVRKRIHDNLTGEIYDGTYGGQDSLCDLLNQLYYEIIKLNLLNNEYEKKLANCEDVNGKLKKNLHFEKNDSEVFETLYNQELEYNKSLIKEIQQLKKDLREIWKISGKIRNFSIRFNEETSESNTDESVEIEKNNKYGHYEVQFREFPAVDEK